MDSLLINIIISVCGFFGVSLCMLIVWQLSQLIQVTKANSAEIAKVHNQGLEHHIHINQLIDGAIKTSENIQHLLSLITDNTKRIETIEKKVA